ncbi:MAG: acetyl-CoA carboxylase carboxyltransferase subunit beta, partial [Hydrogeniiclostridium sp.]
MLNKMNFKKNRNQLEGYNPSLDEASPSVPDALFNKCPECGRVSLSSELSENFLVCPKCGYHIRIPARKRLHVLCDEGSFQEWDSGIYSKDPLSFPGYAVKLKSSRLKSRETSAVITGQGKIGGMDCALFAMEGQFMMGSMGSAVGEKVTRVFERALERRLPVIGFTVSGGARMQEGILSLMQMAKTSGAVKRHSDAGLLYV